MTTNIYQGLKNRSETNHLYRGNLARVRHLKVKTNAKEKRVHSIPVRYSGATTG